MRTLFRGRANAAVAWLVAAGVVAAVALNVRQVAAAWAGLAVLVAAVAVAPVAVRRSWTAAGPWPLLVLATAPLLVRAFGPTAVVDALASLPGGARLLAASAGLVSPAAALEFLAGYADAVGLATAAVLVVAELQTFTAVRLTVPFAGLYVVVATMGLTGLWAVVRWVADPLAAPATNAALMWEFAAATAAALVAGGVFARYFCHPRRCAVEAGA